jgi:hypothetical protein
MRPMLAAMSCASSSRPAALRGSTRSRSGTSDVRLVPVDQRDPIRGDADVARIVGVAVDDASLTPDEPRPRCSASSDALGRHRAEIELRPGLDVQEVGRRSPGSARAVITASMPWTCCSRATTVWLHYCHSSASSSRYGSSNSPSGQTRGRCTATSHRRHPSAAALGGHFVRIHRAGWSGGLSSSRWQPMRADQCRPTRPHHGRPDAADGLLARPPSYKPRAYL